MRWILLAAIVCATVLGDVLQTIEMRRQGEVNDFRPAQFGPWLLRAVLRPYLLAAIFCMAVSFFAFMKLLAIADLSFAVPASAASFVLETVLAKALLKEDVDARRWAGAGLVACGVALLAL